MPAAAPWIVAAVAAAGSTYQGVAANQQAQHAKGAAQAQKTAMDAQTAAAQSLDLAGQKSTADAAAATAAGNANAAANQLYARKRATILTDPNSDTNAPIATKTLLGA